ncbi:MAG: hypothetical protein CFE26_07530, partial [Verrucomicrobiales bacterium VVV1]
MKPKNQNRFLLSALACIGLASHAAFAATYYWDNNGSTAGFGTAAGTWAAPTTGNATQGWSTSTGGTTTPGNITTLSTTNTTTDAINFGNGTTGLAAGTITVSGTVQSGNITFASGSGAITLSGGTINLAAAQTTTVNNASSTIASNLSGSATTFTKAGTGTLYLSGSNTYTGVTTISSGVLVANGASAISGGFNRGGSGAGININNGVLGLGSMGDFYRVVNGASPAAGQIAFASNGGFAAYGADRVVNFNGTNSTTSGGVVAVGSTATGGLVGSLNGKTLILGATDATHKVTVLNTLDFGTGSRSIQVNDGAAAVDGEVSGRLQPQSSGTGVGLIKTGTGTLALSGPNTLNGTIAIQAGQINVATIVDTVSSNLGIGTTVAIGSTTTSASLNYTGTGNTTARVVDMAGTTGGATLTQSGPSGLLKFTSNFTATGAGSKTLTLNGSDLGSGEISGIIVDNSGTNRTSLAKSGTGTWILSGLNTFTGNVTISGGILAAGVTGNGTSSAMGSVSNTRTITVNAGGTLRFSAPNVFSPNFNAPASGLPVLNIAGGTMTNGDSATNSALGNITLSGGTLTATTGSPIGTGQSGEGWGSWNLNGTITSTGTSTISSTAPGGIPITLSADSGNSFLTTFNIQGGTLTASAPFGNVTRVTNLTSTGMTKTGSGAMVLSAANTYTGGTNVNAGTLNVASTGSLDNTAISATGTGIFSVTPGSGTVTLGNTSTAAAGATLNLASGTTF